MGAAAFPREPAGRRDFLRHVSAAAAATIAFGPAQAAEEKKAGDQKPGDQRVADKKTAEQKPVPKPAMPTIALGKHRISRLVAGWNPIGGHSHTTLDMSKCMREYFTVENTVAFLQSCEKHGITAWQYDHTEKSVQVIERLREAGSKLKLICLHAERSVDAPIKTVVEETGPIALVHHGGVTDALFRANKAQSVRDYVKQVHDAGLLAGVSAHNPDNIRRIADQGWENDFFMCSFYYVTRPGEDQQKSLGKVCVGEPFFESDPADMTKVIRQVPKPCLAFKILAAGRACWSKSSLEGAFKFALANIKPTDGLIVGMFPRYNDQVAEDAALVRKFGAEKPA